MLKKVVVLAFTGLLAISTAARAETISILADEWCPYNCAPGSDKPGYMIEVAQKVFGAAGHKVEYKTMNWSRALEVTREGKNLAVAGASPSDAPDFVYPANSLGQMMTAYFTAKDSSWKFSGLASLKGKKLGVIKDYTYSGDADKYITETKDPELVQVMSGDKALEKNINKLVAGRIDAIVEDANVFGLVSKELKLQDKVKQAGSEAPSAIFIAFSPANPKSKEYAKLLSDGVAQLRKSGELAQILKKYNVADWSK